MPPATRVTPDTVMVCPVTETVSPPVPPDAVTYPGWPAVELGGVHPAGTETATVPPATPPVAAVYVKTSWLPVDDAGTCAGMTDTVPLPSPAREERTTS